MGIFENPNHPNGPKSNQPAICLLDQQSFVQQSTIFEK